MLLLFFAAAMPSALGIAPASFDIFELDRHHRSLLGKTVEVTGWVMDCYQYNCALAPTEKGARHWNPGDAWLPLGDAAPELERRLKAARFRQVVLRVRVNGRCWASDGDPCVDRGDPVTPLKIVAPKLATTGRGRK